MQYAFVKHCNNFRTRYRKFRKVRNEKMKFEELVEKVKEFEGFRKTAYLCPAGVLTIGYGRTENVKQNEVTNVSRETIWLKKRLELDMEYVKSKTTKYNLSDNEVYALTDFVFNLGRKKLDTLTVNYTRTKDEIKEAILLYNKANGKVLPGLVKRREWEYRLFSEERQGKLLISLNGKRYEYCGKHKTENGTDYALMKETNVSRETWLSEKEIIEKGKIVFYGI